MNGDVRDLLKHIAHDDYAKVFFDAIFTGYGIQNRHIDWGTPDATMIEALLNSAYRFSSAKFRAQYSELKAGLYHPLTGAKRSLEEYKSFARGVFSDYGNRWLKAEYNMAIGVSQMSRKWAEIQRNKKYLSALEFDAVMDQRTSDKCRELNGKVFHVDDPIWNIIYPPNHWGCRSTVRQVRGRKIMDSSTADTSIVQKGFRHNLAKDGQIHPDESGYFNAVSKSELDELGNPTFKLVERPGRKGEVYESGMAVRLPLSTKTFHDYRNRRMAADVLADRLDERFMVLPEFFDYKDVRFPIYYQNTPYRNKLPDLIGKEYWEVFNIERRLGKKTLKHAFEKYGTQADNLAIVITNIDKDTVLNKIIPRIRTKTPKGKLVIIYEGKIIE